MRHRKCWFCLVLLALAASSVGACSNQGEGQRCDKNSGDSDCASGLVCTPYNAAASSSGTGGASTAGELAEYVCCPQSGSATTTACSGTGTVFDAAVPTETGGAANKDAGLADAAGLGGSGGADGGIPMTDAAATKLDASAKAGP